MHRVFSFITSEAKQKISPKKRKERKEEEREKGKKEGRESEEQQALLIVSILVQLYLVLGTNYPRDKTTEEASLKITCRMTFRLFVWLFRLQEERRGGARP